MSAISADAPVKSGMGPTSASGFCREQEIRLRISWRQLKSIRTIDQRHEEFVIPVTTAVVVRLLLICCFLLLSVLVISPSLRVFDPL